MNYADSSGNDFQSATEFLMKVQRFTLESTVLATVSMMSTTSHLYEVEREMWQDAKDGVATWADGIKKDLYGFYIGALNDFAAKGETQRKIAVGTYIAHKIAWQNLEAFVDGFEQGMGDYHPTYLKYNSERADLQYLVHAGCYTANLAKTVSGVVQVVDGVLLMVDGLFNTAVSPGTGPAAGLVGAAAIEEVALGYGVAAGGTWTLTQSIPAALEEVGAMFSIGINAGKNGVESAGGYNEVNIPKSVERRVKKLSPEAKKEYDRTIEALKSGDTRGLNDHPLSGNRSGQRAIDIKGIGKGRGNGRIIYEYGEKGEINIMKYLQSINILGEQL